MQKLISEHVWQLRSLSFFDLNQCFSNLIASNYQVSFNGKFDVWPVYTGERIGASGPSCSPIL